MRIQMQYYIICNLKTAFKIVLRRCSTRYAKKKLDIGHIAMNDLIRKYMKPPFPSSLSRIRNAVIFLLDFLEDFFNMKISLKNGNPICWLL